MPFRSQAVQHSLAKHPPTPPADSVTTADLFGVQQPGRAALISAKSRPLTVGGVPIANVGTDPARVNPLTATSAEGMPALEILAALASQDPTGVLVIEPASGRDGFGFELQRGRVTAALGPGPLGKLERWCGEVHQRFPERFGNVPPDASGSFDPLWLNIARSFIREHALEFLDASVAPGTRLTLLRGDVEWLGTSIPIDRAPGLQHLLLEQARRQDETPKLLKQLGDLSQLVVPMNEPGEQPPCAGADATDDEWAFDEPDPATLEAWRDARAIWALCDGQHSPEEVVQHGMLGRFRTLSALAMLARNLHVVIIAPEDRQRAMASESSKSAAPIPLRTQESQDATPATDDNDDDDDDDDEPADSVSDSVADPVTDSVAAAPATNVVELPSANRAPTQPLNTAYSLTTRSSRSDKKSERRSLPQAIAASRAAQTEPPSARARAGRGNSSRARTATSASDSTPRPPALEAFTPRSAVPTLAPPPPTSPPQLAIPTPATVSEPVPPPPVETVAPTDDGESASTPDSPTKRFPIAPSLESSGSAEIESDELEVVSALALEAFVADEPQAEAPAVKRDASWQLVALAIVGGLLFASGAAFAMALSRQAQPPTPAATQP